MPKCVKKKRRKDKKREKNLYGVGKRTGEEGEGRMSAWGGKGKLGHEKKRNKKERSGKVSLTWSFSTSLPFNSHLLWTSPLEMHNVYYSLIIIAIWIFRWHNITWWDIWMFERVAKAKHIFHKSVWHRKQQRPVLANKRCFCVRQLHDSTVATRFTTVDTRLADVMSEAVGLLIPIQAVMFKNAAWMKPSDARHYICCTTQTSLYYFDILLYLHDS